MERCKGCVADVLGLCQGDYCRPERDALIENAEERAGERGHVLGAFGKLEGCPVWRAACLRCGQAVVINLDPRPGEADISGEALVSDCSENAASSSA